MAAAISAMSGTAAAAPMTDPNWFTLTGIAGGWAEPDFGIYSSEITKYNPANCPLTDLYLVAAGDSTQQLFAAMLMTAYTTHQQVQITVDGSACYNTRPHIIGVNIRPPQ